MKKKVLMTLIAFWGLLQGAWCYDYPYLTFETADGTTKSLSVESLKIVFSDGQAIVTNEDGEVLFELSDLNKMYFSTTASSLIGDVNRDGYVNVTDAVCIVNEILQPGEQDNIDLLAADVNSDGTINITDVTMLVNLIMQ